RIRRPVDGPAENAAVDRYAERLDESCLSQRGVVVAPYNHRTVYRQCLRRPYNGSHAEVVKIIVGHSGEHVIRLAVLEVKIECPLINRLGPETTKDCMRIILARRIEIQLAVGWRSKTRHVELPVGVQIAKVR